MLAIAEQIGEEGVRSGEGGRRERRGLAVVKLWRLPWCDVEVRWKEEGELFQSVDVSGGDATLPRFIAEQSPSLPL